MKTLIFTALAAACCAGTAAGQVQYSRDAENNVWRLANEQVTVHFHLTPAGSFGLKQISSNATGETWRAPEGTVSPLFRFTLDDRTLSWASWWSVVEEADVDAGRGGRRLKISLQDNGGCTRVDVSIELYPGSPVVRYWADVRNVQGTAVRLNSADLMPLYLHDEGARYRWFRVNQWTILPVEQNFEPLDDALEPAGAALVMQAGARGQQCAWWALRDDAGRGLLAGWEFDGRTTATLRHDGAGGRLRGSVTIDELNHPVEPDETFRIPPAFIGVFHGDWDEAGYRTQRFVEEALAKPMPEPAKFPYAVWNSWGHFAGINEEKMLRSAETAARLGFELFTVDLGWARKIGDWYADETKFPRGLRVVSDYVHSLGMKFGLHIALAEAAPDSAVLTDHPDWTNTEDYYYYGAKSLCLANRPARTWLIDQLVRAIRDYNVDWVLQDGENMVKRCTKTTHTHDPADSNYANAIDGLDFVLREVQRRTPGTVWENCEDGGNMMTFNMVRNYVTSITNDANGALGARQAVYGATYPFPPRYADRYMPENDITSYTTRSFMFGGPWVAMNRLEELDAEETALLTREIAAFKRLRGLVRDGKVYRLTGRPQDQQFDAIQSHNPATDSGASIVTRDHAAAETFALRLRGLAEERTYRVTFQDDPRVLTMSGQQLMNGGVRLTLKAPESAEIVYVEPLQKP